MTTAKTKSKAPGSGTRGRRRAAKAARGSGPRVIRKYPNRRLYDTVESRYVTLDDIRRLVVERIEFVVLDRKSQQDITRNILLQVIAEQEGGGEPVMSRYFLSQVISSYGSGLQDFIGRYLDESPRHSTREQRELRERFRSVVSEDQEASYEFHPLFRRFLLDAAEREDRRRAIRLRMRAAAFLAQAGRIEEAVETYLTAGARMRAAALMESHAQGMDRRAHYQTHEQWMAWAEESPAQDAGGLHPPGLARYRAGQGGRGSPPGQSGSSAARP